MTRKWDIVEDVIAPTAVTEPNAERLNRSERSQSRMAGAVASSLCAVSLIMGSAAAWATQVPVAQPYAYAITKAELVVSTGRRAKGKRVETGATDTDTQVGMSTRRLASLLPTHFRRAPEEADYDGEYSFF